MAAFGPPFLFVNKPEVNVEIPGNLLPTRLQTATGFAHGEYFVVALPGTTIEQVANPDFWLHVASRLRPFDRIEVVAADGSFDMDLRVTATDPRGHYAEVRVLRVWPENGLSAAGNVPPLRAMASPDNDGFVIEEDRVHGWRVLRSGDLIAKNLPDKAAAEAARDAARAGRQIKRAS